MHSLLKSTVCLASSLLISATPAVTTVTGAHSSAILAHNFGDRLAEANRIKNEGLRYAINSQFDLAIASLESALAAYRKLQGETRIPAQVLRARSQEAETLREIATIYMSELAQYDLGVERYEESLAIFRELGDRTLEATTLNRFGNDLFLQRRYAQARARFEQSLEIHREFTGSLSDQASALNNIALTYQREEEYELAVEFYEQSRDIYQSCPSNELTAESCEEGLLSIFNNIATLYTDQGGYNEAISIYAELLEEANLTFKFDILYNLGVLFFKRADDGFPNTDAEIEEYYAQALSYLQQSLAVAYEIESRDNRGEEALALNSIGLLFNKTENRELAIVYLKRAINVYELLRVGTENLDPDLQLSYLSRFEQSYRLLADLLLQQNRILEARQVMDLLKVQEINTYFRQGTRRRGSTPESESTITMRPEEDELFELFRKYQQELVAVGKELSELESLHPIPSERTSEQSDRIRELRQLEFQINQQIQTFFSLPEVKALVESLRVASSESISLDKLNELRDNLIDLDRNAVILYPVVLEDRLELILVTEYTPPIRRTADVRIDRLTLNKTIEELRYALEEPVRDAMTPAQKLYEWMIRPIEEDLLQAEAETIIYAPDLQLRYIPLAALHDGEKWLAESYSVNNISAASLSDINNTPSTEPNILAAAFTEGTYEVQVDNRTISFSGLPYAGVEVNNLAERIPNTVQRLNENFRADLIFEMNDYNIVHLATHAMFNPGPPESSFILFGNGERATLNEAESWTFPNVELVVLSACQTAVGDVPLGDGKEILGFGYSMQTAGADAVVASLWSVDDGGTQLLMNAFYEALHRGGLSKAEALRQAQLELLYANEDRNRGGFELALSDLDSNLDPSDLSHPHYWAPFILIGNGL